MLISLALYHILDLLPSGTKIFYHVLEEPKKKRMENTLSSAWVLQ